MSDRIAWHIANGARVDGEAVVSYGPVGAGHRAARDPAVLIDLGHLAIIDVVGPDARRWANGLFTQNLRAAPVGAVRRTAWCDERGRVLGLADVWVIAEDRLRVVPEGVGAEAFIAHFDRYLLADDAELVDRSAELALLTVQGTRVTPRLDSAGLDMPPPGGFLVAGEGLVGERRRGLAPGCDLIAPRAALVALWRRLIGAGFQAAGLDIAEILRVEAGLVAWPADFAEKRLPHEVGLREAALAFDKGCYVGQETINRLDVRGQARKGLAGLRLASAPPDGAEVLAEGAVIGVISSPVASPLLGGAALAVVRKPWDEGGAEVVVRHEGQEWPARLVAAPAGLVGSG